MHVKIVAAKFPVVRVKYANGILRCKNPSIKLTEFTFSLTAKTIFRSTASQCPSKVDSIEVFGIRVRDEETKCAKDKRDGILCWATMPKIIACCIVVYWLCWSGICVSRTLRHTLQQVNATRQSNTTFKCVWSEWICVVLFSLCFAFVSHVSFVCR